MKFSCVARGEREVGISGDQSDELVCQRRVVKRVTRASDGLELQGGRCKFFRITAGCSLLVVLAAESAGGVEFYLMEQEGSRFSEFETAERCLAAWKRLRAGSPGSGA